MARRPPIRRPHHSPAGNVGATAALHAVAAGPTAQQDNAAGQDNEVADLVQQGMDQLISQFQQMLGQQPDLDPEAREELGRQFGEALRQAEPSGDFDVPTRDELAGQIDEMREQGAMSDDDANAMVRRMTDALEPLQRRESRLAIEFSRRMQAEGEEAALAWFREATRNDSRADAAQGVPSPPDAQPALKAEAVNSRTSRPRGPPLRRV